MAANKLVNYFKAGFPVLNVVSPEEQRAEKEIIEAAKAIGRKVFIWSTTEGILEPTDKGLNSKDSSAEDPITALQWVIKENRKETVYIFRDLYIFFAGQAGGKVCRLIRDIARRFKVEERTLVMVAPANRTPPDLDRDVTLVEFELPTEEDLAGVWDVLIKGNPGVLKLCPAEQRETVIQSARGLTTTEAENAYSKAICDFSGLKDKTKSSIPALVMKEKAQVVKKSGILEYFDVKDTIVDIGGLGNLKKWVGMRKNAFTKKARDFGLPLPKGILLAGAPGTGKSLSAKAICTALGGVPLIRFDIQKCFAGLVGQSELNMRNALNQIDSIGNCVVWMDEMDKAMAGMQGGGTTDSGVGQRVFGTLLTWLSEKTTPAFVVGTVNKTKQLPAELLRKGRWDELFYVPLPSLEERKDIFEIHLRKRGRDPKKFDLKELAAESKEHSGAEIAAAVESAMWIAFNLYDGAKDISQDMLLGSVSNTVPLAKSRADDIKDMVSWAKSNAIWASELDDDASNAARKLDIEMGGAGT